jgi:hypothetical protein
MCTMSPEADLEADYVCLQMLVGGPASLLGGRNYRAAGRILDWFQGCTVRVSQGFDALTVL